MDYGVLVTVLSILVTLLIGWNIWSVIDLKGYKRKYMKLSKKIEQETNYLHNKADFHYGLSMCYNAQSLAGSLSNSSLHNNKFQMYLQAANGLKILSNLGEFDMCRPVIDTLLSTEEDTHDVCLTCVERKQVLVMLKEIPNLDKLDGLLELIEINHKYMLTSN